MLYNQNSIGGYMKAHKKIIIWTFWLSVLFAIGTVVFYVLQCKENTIKIYEWLHNICLSFAAGLIVPCIIEIGNYTSAKNKLYQKLFSDCVSFYNVLKQEMNDLSMIMNIIDINKSLEETKIYANKLNILNDNHINKLENYTKASDFSFISSSDKKLKGKRLSAVFNTVKCIGKLLDIVSQNLVIIKYIDASDYNNAYIECFNAFQNICNIKSELNNCVWEMEKTHKFDISWDKHLLLSYAQNEDAQINNLLAIYRNNANRRFQIKQAFTVANDIAATFSQKQQEHSNNDDIKENKKKRKKSNTQS